MLARLGFWIVLPLLSVLALGMGADRLAVRINHIPSGIRGNFTVDIHNCQDQLCVTSGTFISDSGTIVVPQLLGNYHWQLNEVYRVVYDGSSADVIGLPAVWDPTSTLVGMAGALVFLLVWAWFLGHALLARRDSGRQVPADPVDS